MTSQLDLSNLILSAIDSCNGGMDDEDIPRAEKSERSSKKITKLCKFKKQLIDNIDRNGVIVGISSTSGSHLTVHDVYETFKSLLLLDRTSITEIKNNREWRIRLFPVSSHDKKQLQNALLITKTLAGVDILLTINLPSSSRR